MITNDPYTDQVPDLVDAALHQLRAAGVTISELGSTFRLEAEELEALLNAPREMRAVHQLQLAAALQLHAGRTAKPETSTAIAIVLRAAAIRVLAARIHARMTQWLAEDPATLERHFIDFIIEEAGPEICEYLPIAPGTPNH